MKKGAWTTEEIKQLRVYAKERKYLWTEIAEKMDRSPISVSYMARRNKIPGGAAILGRVGEKNRKYSLELFEKVMRYFVNHTVEETCAHFGLVFREYKSIMTNGYKMPEHRRLRKDTRIKRPWSPEDLRMMTSMAGLMPRSYIGKKIKRGSYHTVKDKLANFGSGTRYLNGLTHPQASELLPGIKLHSIKTKAGSPGPHGAMFTRIIPWVEIENSIKHKRIDPTIRDSIKAMARFQRWIHRANSNQGVISNIKTILRGKV